jgi:hypothetical protein
VAKYVAAIRGRGVISANLTVLRFLREKAARYSGWLTKRR